MGFGGLIASALGGGAKEYTDVATNDLKNQRQIDLAAAIAEGQALRDMRVYEAKANIDTRVKIAAEDREMDPVQLKKQFGNHIVFWGGGIDSQHVLPFSTPERVKKDVRQSLEIFKPGGGYVFNNIHNIQSGVPAQNIIAMYEAAYESGFYH